MDAAGAVLRHLRALFRTGAPVPGPRVGDNTADDLAAEVFVAAFAQRQRYDLARDCARPWLYGIATNLIGTLYFRGQAAF